MGWRSGPARLPRPVVTATFPALRVRQLLVALLMLPGLGCASAEQPAAMQAGRWFQAAMAAGDTAGACALLSDEARGNLEAASATPCTAALARLTLTGDAPQSIEVWGDNAQIRTESGVVFLARFSTGWKVTAAGCQPRGDSPYDCQVEG